METYFGAFELAHGNLTRERVLNDLKTLAHDAEDLLKTTARDASDKVRGNLPSHHRYDRRRESRRL